MSRCSALMSKNCRPFRALHRGRGISRRIPCSKQDLHQNRTNQGSSTALEVILHRPGAGALTAHRVLAACGVGSLPWSIPEQASWPGLSRALPSLWCLLVQRVIQSAPFLQILREATHLPCLLSTGLLFLSSSQQMPTCCSSAVRMDREVDWDELALMVPTNSGQLKSSSLGVWHQRCH